MTQDIYEPREDSFLLLKCISKHIKSKDKVLDIGTGSGILAIEASKIAKNVAASDINKDAIQKLKKNKNIKIKLIHSDLFKNIENRYFQVCSEAKLPASQKFANFLGCSEIKNFRHIKEKFDVIIFNPPYLPSEKIKDIAIDGGKNGTEIIEKFLRGAKYHLNKNGKILLLCSSLNKNIKNLFKKYNYKFKKIASRKFFLEELYVYLLSSSKNS